MGAHRATRRSVGTWLVPAAVPRPRLRRDRHAMKRKRPATALPLEVDGSLQPPLGMPAADFLRDYWQKRPLLIRNAFPGFVSPIAPVDLAGLACEDVALSRLIAHD